MTAFQLLQADDWKTRAVSPVTNPLFFEDPMIRSEVVGLTTPKALFDDRFTVDFVIRF